MAIIDPHKYLKTIKTKNGIDIRLFELENTVKQLQHENDKLKEDVQMLKVFAFEKTRYEQDEDRIMLKLDSLESKLSSDVHKSNLSRLGKFNPFRGM